MEQLGAYLGSSWYPLELAEGIFDVPLEAPFGKRKENQRLILILMDPESLLESTWDNLEPTWGHLATLWSLPRAT